MKRLAILVSCTAVLASAADLAEVHNVYLLRMSKGFDQYLANHLTSGKIFQVVTDPKLADTIITDQIGEAFEAKFNELYPPPEDPAETAKAEEKAKAAKEKDKDQDEAPADSLGLMTDTANKLTPLSSSFGRGKGMVFFVDTKSKQVIWSSYALPKDGTSNQLDQTASAIVSRIKHELNKK